MRIIPTDARPGHPIAVISGGVGVNGSVWSAFRAGLRGTGVDSIVVARPGTSWIGAWEMGDMPTLESETARIEGVLEEVRAVGAEPIVLVVHSAAGFFAEAIAMRSPSLIDGAILVDTSCPEFAFPVWPGLVRSSHLVGKATGRAEVEALLLENATFRYWARDLLDVRELCDGQPAEGIPAAVMVASTGRMLSADVAWKYAHRKIVKQWRRIGADVKDTVAQPSGHMVMLERPDILVNEVKEIVGRHND